MKINTKIIRLFTNKGFYILLALGIGILGASGYVGNLRGRQIDETPVSVTASLQPPKLSDVPAISSDVETVTPAPRSAAAFATAEEETGLMLPIQGELGTGFSVDELVYSKTMQDWRIHKGIDIRGDVGTPVKACASGVVKNVYYDELMGTTVEIQHSGGIETVYSNLQTDELVEIEQKIVRGDIIGGIGMTAQSEISEPPHLHFEVKKDGVNVNPFDYFD